MSLSPRDQHFVKAAWFTAKNALATVGQIHLMAIAIERDIGQINLIPGWATPNKQTFRLLLQLAVKETGSDMVVTLSEAWMLSHPITDEEFKILDQTGLSQHPDRIEVVQVAYATKDGERGYEVRCLVRDEKGKPSIGDVVEFPNNIGFDRVFDDLWPPTVH